MLKYQKGIRVGASAPSYAGLRDLISLGRLFIPSDVAAWTSVADGDGTLVTSGNIISARTGATANSTVVAYTNPGYLNTGVANPSRIDWAKSLVINFDALISAGVDTAKAYVGFIEQNTPAVGDCADLTALGVLLKIANVTITGQAYDGSLGTVAMGTNMVVGKVSHMTIVHTSGVGDDFSVNGIYKGTTTNEPTSQAAAFTRLVVMVDNGATGGDVELEVTNMSIWQAI